MLSEKGNFINFGLFTYSLLFYRFFNLLLLLLQDFNVALPNIVLKRVTLLNDTKHCLLLLLTKKIFYTAIQCLVIIGKK